MDVVRVEGRGILRLHHGVLGLVYRLAPLAAGRGEVERVDDAVLLQTLVHFVHLFTDGVHHILFVLTPSLLVRAELLLLPPLLDANNHDTRHNGDQRHRRRNRRNEHNLGGREGGVRRTVAQRRVGQGGHGEGGVVSSRALTSEAGESSRAQTLELVDMILASAAVEAGVRRALVQLDAAVFTRESGLAGATVVVDKIVASAAIGARLGQAIVHVGLAQRAHEARSADATERVHQVRTRTTVQARVVQLAVINVRLAEWASEADGADALEAVHLVDARAAILATVHSAIIDLLTQANTMLDLSVGLPGKLSVKSFT